MDKKTMGNAVLAVAIVIVLASLFADSIGIGDNPGFGRDQTIGLVAGAMMTIAALYLRGKSD